MGKRMWIRKSNGTWDCVPSWIETQHRAAFVYISDPKAPDFDPELKRATEELNRILQGLMRYNDDPKRQLAIVIMPDPMDHDDDPSGVPMLAWTSEESITREDKKAALDMLPVS